MKAYLKKYQGLMRVVREAHETRKMAHGHEFDHAFAVANLANFFSESLLGVTSSVMHELAWMAGICHNADRIIALDRGTPRGEVPRSDIEALVRSWLDTEPALGNEDKDIIVRAVLNHGKPNEETDDAVTIALKDADRVVNARFDVVIRSGQFQPELPVLDPTLLLEDKRGRYNGRFTIIADLVDCLDWGNLADERFGVRSSAAKKMIVRRVKKLRKFLEDNIEQRREEGLVPYPLELVIREGGRQ